MAGFEEAVSEDRRGILIAIEVTAGAKTSTFPAGYNIWRRAIGCRVSAPALEGRANKAIVVMIAEILEIPVSSVSVASGATSSQKRILVTGIDRQLVLDRLRSRM